MVERLLQVYENEVVNGVANIKTNKTKDKARSGLPLYIRVILGVFVVSMITVYIAGVLGNKKIGYVSAAILLLTLIILFIWVGIADKKYVEKSNVNLLNQYRCDKILMLESILIQSKMYSAEVIKMLVKQCEELMKGKEKSKKKLQGSFFYTFLFATVTGGVKIVMDAAKDLYEKSITNALPESIDSTLINGMLNEAIYTMVLIVVLVIVIVWVIYVWSSQIIPFFSGEEKTYKNLSNLKNDLELILAELIEKNKQS